MATMYRTRASLMENKNNDTATLNPAITTELDVLLESLGHGLPGYRPRTEQQRMAHHVARALFSARSEASHSPEARHLAVCEGQTGTGKTFAYLTAGALAVRNLKKRLVIATATVGLQEQIVARDLPALVEHTGVDLRYGLAKGRGRYLCLSRLHRRDAPHARDFVASESSMTPAQCAAMLAKVATALKDGWDGDRDTWAGEMHTDFWQTLTTDSHACTKRRCPFFASCPYYTARDRLREAQVIVANTDLLLADLDVGGGVLLPKPAETLYVIDEAHHLPDKAIRRFTDSARLQSLERAVERLPVMAAAAARELHSRAVQQHAADIRREAAQSARAIGELYEALANHGTLTVPITHGSDHDLPLVRFPHGRLPGALIRHTENIRSASQALLVHAGAMRETLDSIIEQGDLFAARAEPWVGAMGSLAGRIHRAQRLWETLLEPPTPAAPPVAKWVSVEERRGRLDYVIEAAHVSPDRILRECLWDTAAAAVLTSATLTVAGEFRHFARRTGLEGLSGVGYERYHSPFDYEGRSELHLPAMRANPGDELEFFEEAAHMLPTCAETRAGTLVLFTSYRQMREVLSRVPAPWRARCLVQGESSRETLLATHATRVKAGQPSVLCGLQSFSEGLDLPGDLCRHVIIVKLPFSAPDNPVDQAMAEWITARGGNAFVEMTVPQACVRLVQAVGRLMRRESDEGKVTILDRRILTKGYGKMLLKSLPPIPIKTPERTTAVAGQKR